MNSTMIAAALRRVYSPPKRGFNTKRKRQRKKLLRSKSYRLYNLTFKENPFLKMISKVEDFSGMYAPVPLVYEASNE